MSEATPPGRTGSPLPPVAKRVSSTRIHHGDSVVDEYVWLAGKEDPETLAYLRAENAYADELTAGLADLRERMVAARGTGGGLLVRAVANLAPEAFGAVVAEVPFVDTLNSILDPSLPLTVVEWEEWGDPLHDPEVYAYMKSYSPYENVRAMDYPAMFVETRLNDTRVLYHEPGKWVA
jgi:protease II